MNYKYLRHSWCKWPFSALLLSLILSTVVPINAQPENRLRKNVREYLSFEKLPEHNRSLIRSAITNYYEGEYKKSISALMNLLTNAGLHKPKRSLRAWSNQWLALNYFALEDSVMTIRKHVKLSLEEDVEIWREYSDSRMPQDLREIYQEYWDELQQKFNRKRHSWRFGLGTISRIDYSYRSEILEVLGGIGAPIVADLNNQKIKFKQLLLYTRLQRVRKSIERLFAGYYFEFSFLEEDLNDNMLKEPQKLQFIPVVSAGAVLGYTYKSGWELGASFEVARLLFKKSDADKGGENSRSDGLDFSQTTKIGGWPLSYGNFEFYLRKWF
jgi:hypothetical protein